MARGITVKVSKDKVVNALNAKLKADAKAKVDNEKKRKEYAKVEKAYNKEVADLVLKQIAKASLNVSENYRNEISLNVQLPAGVITLPEITRLKTENELGMYEIREIENAVRILEMSDEEFVSASTMKQIAQYL